MSAPDGRGIRLAELVGVLSLGTDLGHGQPMEHVLRQCLISLRLADRLGLEQDERAVLYYTALLAYVGCHVDAHEQARWLGDDLVAKSDAQRVDFDGGRSDIAYLVGHLGAGRPPLERLRLGLAFLTGEGRKAIEAMFENHEMATERLAAQLDLGQPVIESLRQTFERWDGKGLHRCRGTECPRTARLTIMVDVAEVFHRTAGVDAAVAAVRERSGTQFDPELVELLAAEAGDVLGALDSGSTWDFVIDAEPALQRRLSEDESRRWPSSSISSHRTRSGTRGASPTSPPPRLSAQGCRGKRSTTSGVRACFTILAGSECPTRFGTRRRRSATRNGSAFASIRISASACSVTRRRSRRSLRLPAVITSEWMAPVTRARCGVAP